MKIQAIILSGIILVSSLTGCAKKSATVSRPLLGTVVSITIVSDAEDKTEAFEFAFSEIEDIESLLNPNNPDSEISMINGTGFISPVKTSPETFSLIKKSIEISGKTGGAFDITFASTGKLWDFSREEFTPPDDRRVRALLPLVSWKNISLDERSKSVRLLKGGTRMGLGGIAKGYAAGRAGAALKLKNVSGAIIACAGDIYFLGDNNGRAWRAGIKDPRGESIIGTIDMKDGESVSTSGDYERFAMYKGKRYHHILDPATGYPANSGVISVSVFSSDPVISDAYSTAFFVMGLSKSKNLLASIKGVSAVIVTDDMKIHTSSALKGRITFRDDLKVDYF